jgi:cell division cycle protein 20 (cofactor of APC complex)
MCNMQNGEENNGPSNTSDNLPSTQQLKDAMFQSQDSKILAFKDKPKAADAGYLNHMRVLYTQNKTNAAAPKHTFRAIASAPERILDAPDMSDDFYLNLLDWSAQNLLAVALGPAVYLWNAQSGSIDLLTELEGTDNIVTSVSWSGDGNFLSIGCNSNDVQLWNVEAKKQLRTMRGHSSRVGALAWNNHVLSSGARDGNIFNHDVRIAQHHIGTLRGHSLEVCGLKWSHDGTELASGGNGTIFITTF